MLALARELDFSESTFVLPAEAGGHARVRIFTTAGEIPFAGHPVLGTAFVLAAPLQLARIDLETGSGIVPVALEREGARIVFGRMQQPVPTWRPFERAEEMLAALGLPGDPEARIGPAYRGVRQRRPARLRRAPIGRAGRRAQPRLRSSGARGVRWRELLPRARRMREDPYVRAHVGRARGRRHRICGWAAGRAPRTSWAHRLGRGDRDIAGSRDGPTEHAVRERDRRCRRSYGRGGGWQRGRGGSGEFAV